MFYIEHQLWWWVFSVHSGTDYYERLSGENVESTENSGTLSEVESESDTQNELKNIRDTLNAYVSQIKETANKFNIDGRAIAAIIAYEYECTNTSNYSGFSGLDMFKNDSSEKSDSSGPCNSRMTQYPICVKLKIQDFIPIIGERLNSIADQYFKFSKGIYIKHDPILLSFFFYAGNDKVVKYAKRNQINPREHLMQCSSKAIYVSMSEKAIWMKKELSSFEKFRTVVSVPDYVNVFAVAV